MVTSYSIISRPRVYFCQKISCPKWDWSGHQHLTPLTIVSDRCLTLYFHVQVVGQGPGFHECLVTPPTWRTVHLVDVLDGWLGLRASLWPVLGPWGSQAMGLDQGWIWTPILSLGTPCCLPVVCPDALPLGVVGRGQCCLDKGLWLCLCTGMVPPTWLAVPLPLGSWMGVGAKSALGPLPVTLWGLRLG